MATNKGECGIQQAVFNKFRFSDDDIQIFPDGIMALTESGTIKLLSILSNKVKAAPDMYEALTDFPNPLIRGEFTLEQAQKLLKAWRDKYWYKVLAKAEGKENDGN